MKKIMNIFVLVAAAAMALASCQTQEMEDPTPKEYEYIFEIGNADEEDTPETSATLGDTCVEWESGDELGSFTKTSNGYSAVTVEDGKASFSVYSSGGLDVGQALYFYYPRVVGSDMTADAVSMSIPVSQDGDDDMPLASLPYIVTEASGASQTIYAGKVKFANLGSVIEFNVYTTTSDYASETVKYVSFESETAVAGNFSFDLTKVDYSEQSTLAFTGHEEKTVTVPVAEVQVGTVVEPLKVRMVVAPGSHKGNVVVQTSAAKYTFTLPEKEFPRSAVKPLGLKLRDTEAGKVVREENPADVWTLVTSVDNMPDGEYVILSEYNACGEYAALPSANASSSPKYSTQDIFDPSNPIVEPESVPNNIVWRLTKGTDGNWTIKNSDGGYLYHTASTSGLRVGDTEMTWEISLYGESFCLKSTDSTPRYVGVYNAQDWRPYTTHHTNYKGSDVLYFYYHGTIATVPGVNVQDVTGVSARGTDAGVLEYTLVNPDGSEVEVACDCDIVTAAEVVDGTIHYAVAVNTGDATREGSITVTYGDVVKTVKVSQNAPEFKSSVTNQEILLKADKSADKSFTVTSDFDWTATLSEGAGFTVSPSGYVWEDDPDEEKGKQSVIVTASSANESPDGIVVLGTVTFTSETGQEFIVTVKQESSYVDTSVSTATLTFDDKSKRTSFSTTKQVWEENGITFTNDKTSESSNVADYANPVRCYANSSITVEMAATMSVIEFTCGSSSYATALKNSIGNDATSNGSVVTVNLANPSTSFNVAKLTAQVQLKSITVTYTDGTSGGETPEPEQPETPTPVLSVTGPDELVAAEGGNAKITYSVTNAIDGKSVVASSSQTWVHDFDYTSADEVSFTVDANTGAERTATVTLAYEGAESKTVTITQAASDQGGGSEPITVSKAISAISGTTTNGTKVSTLTLDDVITVTAPSNGDNGKVYEKGTEWRIYQTSQGSVTISAATGYIIKTVKITYKISNTGTLKKGTSNLGSGTVDEVNALSVTYTVGNTGSATNGQVKITNIEVVYQAN